MKTIQSSPLQKTAIVVEMNSRGRNLVIFKGSLISEGEEAVCPAGGLAPGARLELYWQHLEPRSHGVQEPGASGPALRAGVYVSLSACPRLKPRR